jgi:ATP/maltotriose-dependent transcriptional regulator MalT
VSVAAESLIRTKLEAPVPRRPTLVRAPAGWGKTTLPATTGGEPPGERRH